MLEGWLSDDRDYGHYYVPFVVNDDGSLPSREFLDEFNNVVNFMYDNDSVNFGEKPVSHIKVVSNQVLPTATAVSEMKLPMSGIYTTWGYGHTYWTHVFECSLNTLVETVYRHYGSDPKTDTDVWYSTKWELTSGPSGRYRMAWRRGYGTCSEAYGKEYGRDPNGYDAGSGIWYGRYSSNRELFRPYNLSPEEAMRYYDILSSRHSDPDGVLSELFRNAMNSISCNTNTVANCVDIIDTINDIRTGRIFSSVAELASKSNIKKASSLWMGYRYSYQTTKSDIEEYADKICKLAYYNPNSQHIVRSGLSANGNTYHCKVIYHDKRQNDACELYKKLKRSGAALDLYNTWDMVPLSFVVDWFLPIGDFLEDLSSNWVSTPGYFSFSSITISTKWIDKIRTSNGSVTVSAYRRSVTTKPPDFWSYSEDPSTGTVTKRWIDGACLCIK